MDRDPTTYVRALSTLTRQVQEQAPLLAIRDTLRVVGAHAREGDSSFVLQQHTLTVNGEPLDAHAADAHPLTTAMSAHGVTGVVIEHEVAPKELLLLATLLAGSVNPGAPSILTLADDLGLWHVRLDGRRMESDGSGHKSAESAFATPGAVEAEVQLVAARIAAAIDAGEHAEVCSSLLLLFDAEADAAADPTRAEFVPLWAAAFDANASHTALRSAAVQLVADHASREPLLEVLRRAGEGGAGAVVSEMTAASTLRERRILFDAIRSLPSAITVLRRSLDHPQWFVVRNAAALLGELHVNEAESPLSELMLHGDVRVRVAAVASLGKLGSATADRVIERALHDAASEVRRQAFYALISREVPIDDDALADALEMEVSVNIQLDMLEALGRSPSPEAARRLTRICSQAMQGQSDPLFRIAAIEALVRARPSAAMPYLRRMSEDRDPNVRARARALLDEPRG